MVARIGHYAQALARLPLRTRSKVAKQLVCEALGYPVPSSFRRTQPRFPGQLFDTYVQKSNNLQIWNEEIEPTRRYVIISPDSTDVLDTPMLNGQQVRHRDVRYAVFYANSDGNTVTLTHLILTTGMDLFNRYLFPALVA